MTWFESILWLGFWLALSGVYIYIARHFNIVDHPNHRSSHHHTTIRGGGIVFWIGIMISVLLLGHFTLEFGLAIGILGLASFLDDLISIPALTRMIVQLISVILLFFLNEYFNSLFGWSWVAIPIAMVVMLGSLNIYNFMDGINGLNICYTLLGLFSLMLFDQENINTYIFTGLPLIAMAVFNVRPKGKAVFFSGDIGSIASGFLLIYCIFLICMKESSIAYFSLIMLYLIDGGWTIFLRLIKGENVFEAHRSHVFQLLVNELGWGHLKVVAIYVSIQSIINILLYFVLELSIIDLNLWFLVLFITTSIFYFALRYYVKAAMPSTRKSSSEL